MRNFSHMMDSLVRNQRRQGDRMAQLQRQLDRMNAIEQEQVKALQFILQSLEDLVNKLEAREGKT